MFRVYHTYLRYFISGISSQFMPTYISVVPHVSFNYCIFLAYTIVFALDVYTYKLYSLFS